MLSTHSSKSLWHLQNIATKKAQLPHSIHLLILLNVSPCKEWVCSSLIYNISLKIFCRISFNGNFLKIMKFCNSTSKLIFEIDHCHVLWLNCLLIKFRKAGRTARLSRCKCLDPGLGLLIYFCTLLVCFVSHLVSYNPIEWSFSTFWKIYYYPHPGAFLDILKLYSPH